VRELRNVVEQALLCTRGDRIEEAHLGITPASDVLGAPYLGPATGGIEIAGSAHGVDLGAATLDDAERALIGRALAQSKGNVTQAAKNLGISRDTLRYRIEKHGIG
jgi:two-component system, NtrC family, response regulator AtoC